ncbi:hypothetical protein SDC9_93679 [bioreactor metagenome]|uniref:Uncharacterized protein n=1 Tax=bioreactor metagenome TaxID=1076179 RepID=A0A645A1Q9_9ZZZZ|nr:hypothetical protein [Christensenella sp.]
MQEWDVVGVMIALIALMTAVVTPIVKLTHAITKLTTSLDDMEKGMQQLSANNRNAHERIWDYSREQDAKLGDHETRIRVMEEELA